MKKIEKIPLDITPEFRKLLENMGKGDTLRNAEKINELVERLNNLEAYTYPEED